ncbi:MAG TPA: MepB family protein [Pseudobdellovibrionaceae bacterium]|nr:MepB family protein [Pseudobdellovibrionaceae bacterium]
MTTQSKSYSLGMMDLLNNFKILIEQVFEVCGLKYSQPKPEIESSEYQACSFKINSKTVQYRLAKITPTKNGQFVTIWKRAAKNPIQPYDSSDNIDLVVVTVKTKNHFGQFIFPKAALIKQGVFSLNGKGGKQAIRVYPPWDKTESRQAEKTQNWQLEFFAEIPKNKSIDVEKFKSLYSA